MTLRTLLAPCLFASLLFVGGCSPSSDSADVVLINGKVVTVDDAYPEAEAVAIVNDTISAVGSTADIQALIGPDTEVIDLEGGLAIPGFIEGHAHFLQLGHTKTILWLADTQTWEEIVSRVEAAVSEAETGEWIVGRGWHQEKWTSVPEGAVNGIPTHQTLSAVSPDNPVYLRHASGHSVMVNASAMAIANISSETPNPPGGEIFKDLRGAPTGLMLETAERLVSGHLDAYLNARSPEQKHEDALNRIRLASEDALSNGITSFHDAGSTLEAINLLKEAADAGLLPIRVYAMLGGGTLTGNSPTGQGIQSDKLLEIADQFPIIDYGNGKLTVRSVKLVIDGALGSHGAWLLEPYDDDASTSGLNTTAMDELERAAIVARDHGLQVAVHAIGDRGNREVLDLFERVLGDAVADDHRWRIEHAQHLDPQDIGRFADMGVIAAMQGVHATSDGPWVPKRIGHDRAERGAYVWQSLWRSGVVLVNGTDAPVEDVNALASFYATVTRKLNDGTVFFESEKLTREQALRSYTLNGAYAAFQEDKSGSITPGKWADITILSKDIMTIPADEIMETEVVRTIVGGVTYYERPID